MTRCYYSEGQRLNAGFSVWRKQARSSTKSSSGGIATYPAPGAKHKSGITCMRHLRRQKLPVTKKIRRMDSDTNRKILEKAGELTRELHFGWKYCLPHMSNTCNYHCRTGSPLRVGVVILMSDQNDCFWTRETVRKPLSMQFPEQPIIRLPLSDDASIILKW